MLDTQKKRDKIISIKGYTKINKEDKMRRQYFKILFGAIPLVIATVVAMGNILASGTYDMPYSGGSELKEVVIEDANLIDSLSPLVAKKEGITTTTGAGNWIKNVYKKPDGDSCVATSALTFSLGDYSNVIGSSFKISGKEYDATVVFEDVYMTAVGGTSGNITSNDKFTISIVQTSIVMGVGYQLYDQAGCDSDDKIDGIKHLDTTDGAKIFVKTRIYLRKKNQTDNFVADGIYFRLSDIDAAQSYKILNSGNELTANNGSGNGNMYARSKTTLSPTSGSLKNMFNNDYIYSQFSGEDFINCNSSATHGCTDANIYVPLTITTQSDGLNMVFGFANAAGSGMEFYAEQFEVKYESDPNGSITGIASEDVVSGLNPTGSSQTPNEGYTFNCWKADVAVNLNGGGSRAANTCLTDEEVKKVIVTQNITFTAYHDAIPIPQYTVDYASDEYGKITGKTTETVEENNNPTGSSQTPNEGYTFNCWKADVAVNLNGGGSRAANTCLTDEEVKKVIVTQNITFTAYHDAIPSPTQYTVNYESDEYGEITGIKSEKVNENDNPTGSEQKPNGGYDFICWTADVDVSLTDGVTKEAGDCLSEEEVKKVVVDQDITFTANHAPLEEEDDDESYPVATPDTGSSTRTDEINTAILPISILSMISVALISILPRIFHKKVSFKNNNQRF